MERILGISIVGMLALFLVVGGQGAAEGHASRMPLESVSLTKTARLTPMTEMASVDDEWALDCLDAFGPQALTPDDTALRSCLN